MHPLYGAVPDQHVPVRVTRGAMVAHRYTFAPPHCRTSHHRTFIPLSISQWNDLGDPVFDGAGLAGFKSRANASLLAKLLAPFLSPTVFPFCSFILWVGIVGQWFLVLIGCYKSLSPSLALPSFFNNNNCQGTGVLLLDLITKDSKISKLYCIEKSITNNRNTGNKSLYNCTKKIKILFNSSKHENILS